MMVLTPDVGDIADVPDPLHGLAMSSWLIEGFTVSGEWQGIGCFVRRGRLSIAVEGGARRFAECRVKTVKAMQICSILRHGELQCHQDCARRAFGLLPSSGYDIVRQGSFCWPEERGDKKKSRGWRRA